MSMEARELENDLLKSDFSGERFLMFQSLENLARMTNVEGLSEEAVEVIEEHVSRCYNHIEQEEFDDWKRGYCIFPRVFEEGAVCEGDGGLYLDELYESLLHVESMPF